MLRTHWFKSASAVVNYLAFADYFSVTPGELLGSGFKYLELGDMKARDVFECVAHNLDPATGEKLRPHFRQGDRVGMDFTFNAPKSVSIAREIAGKNNQGDDLIEQAHREAVAYAFRAIERDMVTRVKGGREPDRYVRNAMAYRVTHRDTRVNPDDKKPDMSLHDHLFAINTIYDPVEKKWKAAELGQIKHDAPFFESLYHSRLASNLKQLGYGIRRKGKTFEIEGISDSMVKKFSRRREYIKQQAEKIGIKTPEGMAKMGATTRLGKTKETEVNLHGYYVSRLTKGEKTPLQNLKGKPSYECSVEDAVAHSLGHHFYRRSVVGQQRPDKLGDKAYENGLYTLMETALRHGIGSVDMPGLMQEFNRQGLLQEGWEVTTQNVLEQEGRIISFAREGRGTMRPLNHSMGAFSANPSKSKSVDSATLSPEQQVAISHVWNSTDQVILIRGGAGTGKTTMMKTAIAGIDKPVAVLAPSAEASRGILQREGFKDANTVAAFLNDAQWQQRMKDGVLWVDEAGLLPVKDLDQLSEIAGQLNARLVLQGDHRQHKSVTRHGNMFHVLQKYAGLPLAELKDIKRQKGKYKEAVAAIQNGDILKGHDILTEMGSIKHVFGNHDIVSDYLHARHDGKTALVVAPTHAVGDAIAGEIRHCLRQDGTIGKEERKFTQYRNLGWSPAQKSDLDGYDGSEMVQFFKSSGAFQAGSKYRVGDLLSAQQQKTRRHRGPRSTKPAFVADRFAVFSTGQIGLSAGDAIRITAGGKTADGHQLNNGSVYTVKGFTDRGDIALTNGWVIPKDFGHLTHAYTSTSYGAQGKTVDRVLIAMNRQTAPALNAEQFYVSASRGRESATIYTDMNASEMRALIKRQDSRKSASELMGRHKRKPGRIKELARRARQSVVRRLYDHQQSAIPPEIPRHKIERSQGRDR